MEKARPAAPTTTLTFDNGPLPFNHPPLCHPERSRVICSSTPPQTEVLVTPWLFPRGASETENPQNEKFVWGSRNCRSLGFAPSKNISKKRHQHRDLSAPLRSGRDDKG